MGQFEKVKRNQFFTTFSEKLIEYFNTHMMPANAEIIHYEMYFTFESDVKRAKWFIQILNEDICKITILPNNKGIELYRFEMYKTGKGFGSIFMNAINEVSKQTGIFVYLIPGVPGFNTQGDPDKRRNFYHKFGYKRLPNSKFWSNQII